MNAAPAFQSDDTPLILGIESSCDETAAAIVRGGRDVLSNIVATQHELHKEFAGVVPEIASRAHLERICPVIESAVAQANVTFDLIDGIAVGHRPGLIGSLLVGVSAAKALSWSLGKPLIGVDHVLAHLWAARLNDAPIEYPALGLVVSGGHSSLYHMTGPVDCHCVGRTIDDAIGEAYDKAATILDLGYPGGPRLDALAQTGDDRAHDFPVANLGADQRLNFSFSGLKTSLLYRVCGQPVGRGSEARFERDASAYSEQQIADFAASFQRAAVRAVTRNIMRALDGDAGADVRSIVVGGGVAANSRLRNELRELAAKRKLALRIPPIAFCVDNAAMIAGLAAERYRQRQFDDLSLEPATHTALV